MVGGSHGARARERDAKNTEATSDHPEEKEAGTPKPYAVRRPDRWGRLHQEDAQHHAEDVATRSGAGMEPKGGHIGSHGRRAQTTVCRDFGEAWPHRG